MIWSPIDRVLCGIALILFLICALKYLSLARKNENPDERRISNGFSIFFFCLMMTTIFLLILESLIPGKFINDIFYGNYDAALSNPSYIISWKLNMVFYFGGFIYFFYVFERIVKRSKYLITILYGIGLVLIIILPYELAHFFIYNLLSTYVGITYLGILLYYTRSSRRELKAISSFILIGSLLIAIGATLIADIIKSLNSVPTILAPICWILGTLFCITPTMINAESMMKYLKITCILSVGVVSIIIFATIIYGLPLGLVIAYIIAITLVSLIVLNVIRSSKSLKDKDERKDFFEAFIKPKKLTEEEVSVSKEKKICLVCKSVLGRILYMCPECNSFYCLKCSKALSNLENACWVCEMPFDESKPIKLGEKKEEEIKIKEEERQKKGEKK